MIIKVRARCEIKKTICKYGSKASLRIQDAAHALNTQNALNNPYNHRIICRDWAFNDRIT